MQLNLDTAQKLRDNWQYLTAEQITALIDEGVVSVAIRAAINANADWRIYQGRVDVSSYYRAYGEYIAEKAPYATIALDAQTTQNVALMLLQAAPGVYDAFLAANDGLPMEVLPPYIPPVPEPEEIPDVPESEEPEAPETPQESV